MGYARMESVLRNGMVNGSITRHDKTQDPTIGLIGNKRPLVLWLADYSVYSGTTLSSVYNLIPGGSGMSIGSSPAYIEDGVFNTRSYIDFNSAADRVYTTSTSLMSGKNEITIVMLCKLTSTADRTLFYKIDSTITNTIGDLHVQSIGGNKVRVTFIGNPTTTSAVYETYDATIEGSWFLLTVKARLYQPNGQGSELEIYVNGTQNQTPITTTFVGSTSNFTSDPLYFGNNTSATAGGSQIAGGFVADYWLNSVEQIRIENFFRWYYGYRF